MNPRMLKTIRQTVAKFLTDRCTIEREVVTTGTMGEELHVWDTIALNVPCRIITTGGTLANQMNDVGAQEAMVTRYRLTVPYTQNLGVNERVTCGGVVWQITAVLEKRTDSTDTQAIIVRVDNE